MVNKLFLAAAMFAVALANEPEPESQPSMSASGEGNGEIDMLLSGACRTCMDHNDDPVLCAGFALPLCKVHDIMKPGYCQYCDNFYERKADRTTCIERMARFTESDTCVDLRVMENREERHRVDAANRARAQERRDDRMKHEAAVAAEAAADDAEQARQDALVAKHIAEQAADHTQNLRLEAQDRKKDAKMADIAAQDALEEAQRIAEEKNENHILKIKQLNAAERAYQQALQEEAAKKAAYMSATRNAEALQEEADRLRKVSMHS